MIIKKLYIKSFGGLSEFSLDFSSGINLIEGRNESGKTTLASFIVYVLYGFDKNEKILRTPWDGMPCSGWIEIENDGENYRIERSANEAAKIIDLTSNKQYMKGKVPGEVFLGIPCNLFVRSIYVGQADGGYVNSADLRELIGNILFSADEAVSVQRSLKKLDELRVSLLHKNGKGGKLYEYAQEREKLSNRLKKASEDNKQIISLECTLRETRSILDKRRDELEKCKKIIEFHEAAAALEKIDTVRLYDRKEAELIGEYNDLITRNTHNGFIPDSGYVANISRLGSDIAHLEEDILLIRGESEDVASAEENDLELQKRMAAIRSFGGQKAFLSLFAKNRKKAVAFGVVSAMIACAAIVGILFSVWSLLSDKSVILSALFSVITALAAIILSAFSLGNVKANKEMLRLICADKNDQPEEILSTVEEEEIKRNLRTERLTELENKLYTLEERKKEKSNELERLLSIWNCNNINDAVEGAEMLNKRLEVLSHSLDVNRASRSALKQETTSYDEVYLRGRFAALEKDCRKTVSDSQFSIANERKKQEFLTQAINSLTERCHSIDKNLTELISKNENPSHISDAIYSLDTQINSDTARYKACVTAMQKLSEASLNMRQSVAPRISEKASAIMSVSSDGSCVSLDLNEDMALEFKKNEENGISENRHSIDFLSAGTRDLAYISLRLSLGNLLCRFSSPPVVFDESFSRLDDGRLENVFRIINEYSQNRNQVIILTSQKREAEILRRITEFEHIIL